VKCPIEKPGTPAELVHHGVLGMKWGVHRTEGSKTFYSKYPTPQAREKEIKRARANVKTGDISLKHPDQATALRMTRGEKWVAAALYTLAPTIVVPVATAAYVGSRVHARRSIEK
jgi:hypothetical protein